MCRARNQPDKAQKNDTLVKVVKESEEKARASIKGTPLHKGHLKLMTRVTSAGGVIKSPVPAFYYMPQAIDDLIDQTVGKSARSFLHRRPTIQKMGDKGRGWVQRG
jgi:3-polyprenyl-4-hydroxybenzoate decarboxylase